MTARSSDCVSEGKKSSIRRLLLWVCACNARRAWGVSGVWLQCAARGTNTAQLRVHGVGVGRCGALAR